MRSKSVLTGNRCSRPSFVIISTDYDQLRLRCIYGSSSGGCSGGGGEMKGLGGEEGKGGNVYKRNKGKVRKRGGVKHYNYIRTEKLLKNIFDK